MDPYFHDEVGELWSKHRNKFLLANSSSTRTITIFASGVRNIANEKPKQSYCYAATNRDEFLAEVHCIAQDLHIKSKDYNRCNMSTSKELRQAMPEVYRLLESHFSLPKVETAAADST